ncbi:hypothetical protein FALBO_2144 [Fusarium albosuccineum]|uniref:Uncharacterized protein n=1 Tax=Fusarium albosuccineum TaxID=1237068 RepID=A0A8H4LN99_9HYPO|nr:hypothetical protein FALBO_2144 [Fusarium albosuccineum]
MPFQCNNCSLDPFPMILNESFSGSMPSIYTDLGYTLNGKKKCGSLINVVKSYPQYFTSSGEIPGWQLLDWENPVHREGLAEMAHAFLCINGNGPLYWRSGHRTRDNDLLEYSQYSNEIYDHVIRLFYKVNHHLQGERRVLRQDQASPVVDVLRYHGGRHDDPINGPIDVDSLMEMAIPPDDKASVDPNLIQDRQVVADDMEIEPVGLEDGGSPPASVQPESDLTHPTESPDPLLVDDVSYTAFYTQQSSLINEQATIQLPDVPLGSTHTRRVKRRRDDRGSMPEFMLYRSATPGPSRQPQTERPTTPEAVPNNLMHSATQANNRPEEVDHNRAGSEPHSMSMDTESSTDEPGHTPSQDDNYNHRRLQPSPETVHNSQQSQGSATQESGTQTDAAALPPPPEAEPSRQALPLKAPTSGPEHQVDLAFSVEVGAGLNLRWNPRGEFSQYTLEQLLQEMSPYWNEDFHSLLIFLETPRRLIVEVVHKGEEKEFRIALTRFAQKLATLGFWRGEWDRHVVLEICLEQIAKGEDLDQRLRTLVDRATKEGCVAL